MADSYVNTRTIMGDQEAFDALIAGELEDLVEDGVIYIKEYTIYNNDGIKSIKLPNLKNINGSHAIGGNKELEVIDIGNNSSFYSESLTENRKLISLILRSNTKTSYSYKMLEDTPIYYNAGGIFVADNLVDLYKADSSWSMYNIYGISDYPVTDFSTITDTWSEIFANESNGTYSTKYSLGDTKKITINNNDYYAQIVAFDADPLSDTSGNAKITWVLKELYADTHRMNPDRGSNWTNSELRAWLASDVFLLFPEMIRTSIKEVKKISYDYSISGDVTSNDKLWIPSIREVFGDYNTSVKESSGPSYAAVFDSNLKRVKYKDYKAAEWFLRTTVTKDAYYYITLGGGITSNTYYIPKYPCLGFCT